MPNEVGAEPMGDREYLYELALILDSAEGEQRFGEPTFIRIEAMTAKDIAVILRRIASRMPSEAHQ